MKIIKFRVYDTKHKTMFCIKKLSFFNDLSERILLPQACAG